FWVLGLGVLLYAPMEQLLAARTTPYLIGLGCKARRTAWLLTGFWLAFLGARILAALLLEPGPPRAGLETWTLFRLVAVVAVLLSNLAGTTSRSFAAVGILLLGFCLGPVFPTLVGLGFEKYPNEPGGVVGVLFALKAIGSVVLLPLTDDAARRSRSERT